MSWTTDEWKGCYPSSWKGMIVPEAMAHPAKFSSKLIRRIYEHMRAEKWVKPGDRVIDPFGGVALGALDAMRLGLEWLGMELEVKFVDIGNHNISNWELKFGRSMPNWGSARLVQGDSRRMLENLGLGRATVSSPPYADSVNQGDGANDGEARIERKAGAGIDVSKAKNNGGPNSVLNTAQVYGSTPGQLGSMKDNGDSRAAAMKSSPPFGSNDSAHAQRLERREDESADWIKGNTGWKTGYGNSDGQLADMGDGGFNAAISSPPFLQSEGGAHIPSFYADDPTFMQRHAAGNGSSKAYGGADGQLGNMTGDFASAVSSPPFEDQLPSNNNFVAPHDSTRLMDSEGYGDTDGNIGNDSGSDFWTAARQIVEQVYLALAPGGHAVWVVKNYVKNKQMVPFSDQWRQLCEAVGFETLHEHRALLVHATSLTLDGKEVHKESKSFFRRLAEKKGSPRIDFETVYCMVKR